MKNRTLLFGVGTLLVWGVCTRAGAEERPRVRPKTYGTSQDSIYHVPVTDFVPIFGNSITTDGSIPNAVARYTTNCGGYCIQAIPRLPNGALLTSIEAYFCNTNPDHSHTLGVELYKTLYDGTGLIPLGVGVYSTSQNGCGEFEIVDLTSLNYQVNYYDNQLILAAVIDDQDGAQALAGVNLYYRLQVSPAPPAATFNDVPTSDPAFQFVEALVASGITVGCGGGNYCPNEPLTRRQMAVFLSKALGLQWP
jgi:S-layer homology domain